MRILKLFAVMALGIAFVACEKDAPKEVPIPVTTAPKQTFKIAPGQEILVLPTESEVSLQGRLIGGIPTLLSYLEERKILISNIYRNALRFDTTIAGRLNLNVTVDPGGDISRIFVEGGGTGFGDFDVTLKNSIARWKFPDSEQGKYTVVFPLTFKVDK